jgi:hypothetical protein
MRRAAWITVAATVLGLATGGVSFASQGPSSAGAQVLNLISRATDINDFVDTGPTGPSPGDLYVFSDRLFLAATPDDQVGISDGRCVLIDPSALRFDCSITAKFSEGDIMVAGTLTLVEGTTSVGAIVGGTGEYRKVRGEASTKLGPLEGPHEATLKLILNP